MQKPESSGSGTGKRLPGARSARLALFIAVLVFGAACAASRPDIIQVGPWFAAKPPSEVQVFSAREQVVKPWGAIAIIHSKKFPSEDRGALERQRKAARKLAAEAGADGLIIVEESVMGGSAMGDYEEPETYISALAFKYVTDISTSTKK